MDVQRQTSTTDGRTDGTTGRNTNNRRRGMGETDRLARGRGDVRDAYYGTMMIGGGVSPNFNGNHAMDDVAMDDDARWMTRARRRTWRKYCASSSASVMTIGIVGVGAVAWMGTGGGLWKTTSSAAGETTRMMRTSELGVPRAPSAGFVAPFELPEDLHAAIAALGDEPTMGIEGDVDSYEGLEELPGGGYAVEIDGGLNATLRRLESYMRMNQAKDMENEQCEAEKEAMGEAAFDEGATMPLHVNTSEYIGTLKAEIAQDEHTLEVHDKILEARAAARLGKTSKWGDTASNTLDGAGTVNTELNNHGVFSGDYCWRDSYGRGVGVVPSHCPSHKETLAGGIICYDKCHNFGSNWYRFGYDCHQSCNSGWSDHGLLCHKSNWGRGVGEARCEWQEWWAAADLGEAGTAQPTHQRKLLGGAVNTVVQAVRKTKLVCGGSLCSRVGKQDCLGLCYPPCPSSNPVWIGCNLCGASCSGYAGGIAPSCMKGVKTSPGMEWAKCPPGWDYDAGLCYEPCRNGFTGVGPVCWGDAPIVNGRRWVKCGMGAATDSGVCAQRTADQILGPLEMVAFVATAGGSGAATAATKATKAASAAKELRKVGQEAFDTYQNYMSFQSGLTDLESANSPTEYTRAASSLLGMVDPTGISSTIGAYTFDTCDKIHD